MKTGENDQRFSEELAEKKFSQMEILMENDVKEREVRGSY